MLADIPAAFTTPLGASVATVECVERGFVVRDVLVDLSLYIRDDFERHSEFARDSDEILVNATHPIPASLTVRCGWRSLRKGRGSVSGVHRH
jgi:hypothetical protein